MVFLHDYIFRLIFNTYYKNGMEIGQKSHFFLPQSAGRPTPIGFPLLGIWAE